MLFQREPSEIEPVVSGLGEAETDWYAQEHGGGIMIVELKVFGRVFPADQLEETEDLEFITRASGQE